MTNEEERQAAVDPFFLATFLGVLALGLVSYRFNPGVILTQGKERDLSALEYRVK